MGITLDDLNAQRAMLKRGEEKRKADWQQAERERLRDTFAAAALTGLMSRVAGKAESFAEAAYKLADAMLRERSRAGQTAEDTTPQSRTGTIHDAVPEARARDADRGRTDKAVTRPGDGTGDTPSDAEIDALEFVVVMGRVANGWDKDILRQWLIRLRPEFDSAKAIKEGESDRSQPIKEGESDRSQPIGSPAKTNPTQPRNGTPVEGSVRGEGSVPDSRSENEPVAWAALRDDGDIAWIGYTPEGAADGACGRRIIPLYRHPQDWAFLNDEIASLREAIRRLAEQDATLSVCDGNVTVTMDATLTDEEREAVEAADAYMSAAGCRNTNVQSTLRKLLERLK